jgi:hypothetical protein
VRIGTFRTVSEEAFCEVHTLHSPGPTPPGQTALAFAGWGTPPEGPPFPSYSYHFPTRLLSNHKTLYEDHSFAVYALALLGTTISVSLSRAPLIPPPRISAPAFLFLFYSYRAVAKLTHQRGGRGFLCL